MPGRVVVVGSVNVDLVVVAPRLPGPGETVTGGDVARHHGGKGGNQAAAAARLGAPVAFVGAVGEDDFGAAARVAPVDTTGAGDAFNGALAVDLAAGLPLAEAVRRAVAAAGLSTRPGRARAAECRRRRSWRPSSRNDVHGPNGTCRVAPHGPRLPHPASRWR